MKINQTNLNELLERGVENIYPDKNELKKILLTNHRLRIYQGFDPTGPTLHLGHVAGLLKMRQFQDLGHKIIILIGDFTAQIGDPDKKAVRTQLKPEEVKNNLKNYRQQIGKILNLKKTEIVFNNKWLSKIKLPEILKIASEFTVSQIMERDMFQERLKSNLPIYLHEFFYPLMQGYDSVFLKADLEIGGNDQTFNMLTGRTMAKHRNQEKMVMSIKLLTDSGGKKMGKTEGNMITFNDKPGDIFGKVMSFNDQLMPLAFELYSNKSLTTVKKNINQNPRDAKLELAEIITSIFYNQSEANKAKDQFTKTFSLKEPTGIKTIKIKKGMLLIDILLKQKLVSSKSDFRRLVNSGGVTINKEKISDDKIKINNDCLIKIGKKKFIDLKIR